MSLGQLAKAIGCSYQKVLSLVRTGRKCVDGRIATLDAVRTESGMSSSLQAYRRFQIELNRRESVDD